MNKDIYEVERQDYQAFVERLIPDKSDIEVFHDKDISITKIISKKTGKVWCERIQNDEEETQKFYIFEYPDSDEWGAPIPKRRIVLETKEEVQSFFDALSALRREKNGTIS